MIYLALVFVFMIGQGFFSGMETGLVSVLLPRAEHAARRGVGSAKLLVFFQHNSGIMISTALISVNLCVVMASLMTKKFMEYLQVDDGVWLFVSGVTLSVLLLAAEIIPKTWFREAAFERCSAFIYIFYAMYIILYAPVKIFAAFTEFLTKSVEKFRKSGESAPDEEAREKFRLYLNESKISGSVDEETVSIIDRALTAPGSIVSRMMIPGSALHELPEDASVLEAFEFANSRNVTKIPLRSKNGGCERVLNIYDAIYNLDEKDWAHTPASAYAETPEYITPDFTLGRLLSMLRTSRVNLFVVRDAHGETLGVIRPEDFAYLLFGRATSA